MMSKTLSSIATLVVLLLCVALVVCISGCLEDVVKEPTCEIDNIKFTDITTTPAGIKLEVALTIDNPNPIGASFKKAEYNIYLNDQYIGKSVDERSFAVNANAKTDITSHLVIEGDGVAKTLPSVVAQNKATIKVEGTAHLDLKATTYPISFASTKTFTGSELPAVPTGNNLQHTEDEPPTGSELPAMPEKVPVIIP